MLEAIWLSSLNLLMEKLIQRESKLANVIFLRVPALKIDHNCSLIGLFYNLCIRQEKDNIIMTWKTSAKNQ